MTSSVSTNKLINIVGSSSNTAATIEVNGSTIVLNQDAGSITFTDTVEEVTTDQNQTELKINTEGDTVFFSAQRGWLNYVAGFQAIKADLNIINVGVQKASNFVRHTTDL